MVIILTLCSCLLLPLILAAYFILRKVLVQRRMASTKTVISSAPTMSTAISIDLPAEDQAGSLSTSSPASTQITNTPMAVLPFSPRFTPYGTCRKPLDLASSLKASLSKGPDALAAALDGVLALHHRLEEMRHQRSDSSPHQDRDILTSNPTDMGQIVYM